MLRSATPRFKCNPLKGRMPVLQNLPCHELKIDHTYQRAIATPASQTLITRIARDWDWSMCQPLVVAERSSDEGSLYVIDGQHRLAAARLRNDIYQLPCVVIRSAGVEAEAAMFWQMNGARQPLTRLDLFKAAMASGDPVAKALSAAIASAGLKLATHTNNASWGPGVIGNISTLSRSWKSPGPAATSLALYVLGAAWRGQTLRQSGTLFPGILGVVSDELKKNACLTAESEEVDMLTEMVGEAPQEDWLRDIHMLRANNAGLVFEAASQQVFRNAWAELIAAFRDEAA